MPPSRVTAILLFPRATLSPSSSAYRSISTQPLRPQLHPRQQQQQFTKPTISFFSTSNPTWAREPNFYEILDVPTTASAAEIKKYTHTIIPPAPSPYPIPYMFLNTYLHTNRQTILRPLNAPPPRPQPHRPRRKPTLRPHFRRLQCPRQRCKACSL